MLPSLLRSEQHGLVRRLAGEARGTRHHSANTSRAVKTREGVREARVGAAPGEPTEVAHHRGVEGKPPEAGANQHHRPRRGQDVAEPLAIGTAWARKASCR